MSQRGSRSRQPRKADDTAPATSHLIQQQGASNLPANTRNWSSIPKKLPDNQISLKFIQQPAGKPRLQSRKSQKEGQVSYIDPAAYERGSQRALDSEIVPGSLLRKCPACGLRMHCEEGESEVICFCGNNFQIQEREISVPKPLPQARRTDLPTKMEGKQSTYGFIEGKLSVMGLPNLGLSCFMNSALNSLYFVPLFYKHFINLPPSSKKNLTSWINLFTKTYGQSRIQTSHLRAIRNQFPQFRDGSMGSAFEFILNLLQVLDEEAQENEHSTSPLFPSRRDENWRIQLECRIAAGCRPLHDLFSVVVEEVLRCEICSNSSVRYSYLRALSINIPSEGAFESAQNFPASINTCLSNFLSKRRYLMSNARCCTCQSYQTYTITRSLKHIGAALIIHLQRYHSVNPYAEVTVPGDLNMSTYLPKAGNYSLCSAILHRGTVLSGHYTCYARTSHDWMLFNDHRAFVLQEWPEQALQSSTLFIYAKSAS